jgi:type IV secretion system protein VirD4
MPLVLITAVNIIVQQVINTLIKLKIYNMQFPQFFDKLNLLQILIISIAIISLKVLFSLTLRNIRKSKPIKNLHGSARFAAFAEVNNTGLINNPNGVYIGAIEHKNKLYYLRHDGAEHCLALAPTRSGKGICLVVPTLLTWQHSAIIYDIKRELWHLTSNYRKKIGTCFLFDPASSESNFFNPLQEVRINTEKQVADAQNIAEMLVDGQGKGMDNHWDKTSYELLTGTILYLLHQNKNAKLSDILTFFSSEQTNHKVMDKIAKFECEDKIAQGEIQNVGKSMFAKPEKELGSIVSSATACLSIFRDPMIQNITSYSEFSINDIVNSKQPVSLYIATDPNNMDRLRPLIRLLINQILRKLTESMKFEKGQASSPHMHKLLLMLDEFTSLGKLEILQKSLAFMASYGIKAYLIAQDISQIHQHYTKFESITANCNVQIAFTPNKLETAQYLSSYLGNRTEYKTHVAISGKSSAVINDGYSSHIDEIKRPLMTIEEILSMQGLTKQDNKVIDTGNMLIFVNGIRPIFGKQAPYFMNKAMLGRINY